MPKDPLTKERDKYLLPFIQSYINYIHYVELNSAES